jgi:hypothetical protein
VGEATGAGATSGGADADNNAQVHQMNIQVIAGGPENEANSIQTATNEANVGQMAGAASGDTDADGGSTATSGDATAANFALVHQMNIQVIAGRGCAVTQEASNVANLDQTALAVTGAASASDSSSASSGDATAGNRHVVQQKNIQVYVCKNGATGSQVASNVADIDSMVGAATGNATSSGASTASTGDATGSSEGSVSQTNHQFAAE